MSNIEKIIWVGFYGYMLWLTINLILYVVKI